MDTDESLHAAWAGGDKDAGGRLVDRYLGPMERFFANKISDRSELEDLVADTFQICSKSLRGFRGDSSFRTYLYGIARNVLRTYVRKKGRFAGDPDLAETAIADLAPSQSSILHGKDEQRLLLEALRAIPVELQILLEMTYFENMTGRELAGVLQLPQGTVATRLRRARKLLRSKMEAMSSSARLLESTVTDLEGWARQIRARLGAAE